MRSLTLAEALAARGAACAFAAPPEARAIVEGFGSGAVACLAADGTVATGAAVAQAWRADWVVIDHYRMERRDETALRAPGRRIAVIDDLAERGRDCDLLLDPSYGRTEQAYAALVPPAARVLAGPRYALVRPEFAEAREAVLARRGEGPVRRGLISLGLTDVGGITARVVDALRPALGDIALDVVLGAAAPSLGHLTRLAAEDPRLRLHVDTRRMADLMGGADLAVGAGGSSTWERCCLGLPALTLVLAPNQTPLAAAFDRNGISPSVGLEATDAAIVDAWRGLVTSGARRAALSERSAALCDGQGAARVAAALSGL